MMGSVAFCVLAFMLGAYVLLDGYDLGVGASAMLVAKTSGERKAMIESIGPFWNGNEVWLVAAAGGLFAMFPVTYALLFSAFYLPFIVALWLLMVRGIAIELRGYLPSKIWKAFWDVAWSMSSALLIVLFGIALGDMLRGLPLSPTFFPGTFWWLLNPFALMVGVLALCSLVQHGLAYIAVTVEGELSERALRYITRIWWLVAVAYLAVTTATHQYSRGELGFGTLTVAIAVPSLVALRSSAIRRRALATFRASIAFVAAMVVAAATTLYPYLSATPLSPNVTTSVDIAIVGLVVLVFYSILVRRRLSQKVRVHR